MQYDLLSQTLTDMKKTVRYKLKSDEKKESVPLKIILFFTHFHLFFSFFMSQNYNTPVPQPSF